MPSLLKKRQKETFYDHVAGPKNPILGSGVLRGRPIASAVFVQTVFPHQFGPSIPVGKITAKNITTTPIAVPASKPADKI
jgi:hypothetical protein